MTQALTVTPSADKLVDLKIAHLNMVQGAVTRMAGFSASAKTFCITILAAIIALSVQARTAKLALGAIFAVICLGLLDLYYLTLELRFRAAYERIAQRLLSDAADLRIKPASLTLACLGKAARSLSILLFYVPSCWPVLSLSCMVQRMSGNPPSNYLEELLEALEGHGGLNPPTPKLTGLAALFATPPQPNALTLASLASPLKSTLGGLFGRASPPSPTQPALGTTNPFFKPQPSALGFFGVPSKPAPTGNPFANLSNGFRPRRIAAYGRKPSSRIRVR